MRLPRDLLLVTTVVLLLGRGHSESYSCNPPTTFQEKIGRILDYNDADGDGVVTAKDRDRNIILYDSNLDSFVTTNEFVVEWMCRYGDHADVANRIFDQLAQGSSILTFEAMRNTPNVSREDFKNFITNMYTDEVTDGKSYSCNTPTTFPEKVERILDYADNDGDGVVTAKDFDREFIFFDHDLDNVVTPYEFISEWTCRYGDHPDVASRIFYTMSRGDSVINFQTTPGFRDFPSTSREDYRSTVLSMFTEEEMKAG